VAHKQKRHERGTVVGEGSGWRMNKRGVREAEWLVEAASLSIMIEGLKAQHLRFKEEE